MYRSFFEFHSVLILKNAITPQWKVIALTKKLLSSKQSTPLYSIEISPVEELFLPGGHLEMAVISPPMSLDEIDIKKQCRQLEFFQAPALPLYRIIIVLYFHYLIGYFKFLSLINQTEDTFSIHLCQGKHIHIVF